MQDVEETRERQTLTFTHLAPIGLLRRLHSDKEEALRDGARGGGAREQRESDGNKCVCVCVLMVSVCDAPERGC